MLQGPRGSGVGVESFRASCVVRVPSLWVAFRDLWKLWPSCGAVRGFIG